MKKRTNYVPGCHYVPERHIVPYHKDQCLLPQRLLQDQRVMVFHHSPPLRGFLCQSKKIKKIKIKKNLVLRTILSPPIFLRMGNFIWGWGVPPLKKID